MIDIDSVARAIAGVKYSYYLGTPEQKASVIDANLKLFREMAEAAVTSITGQLAVGQTTPHDAPKPFPGRLVEQPVIAAPVMGVGLEADEEAGECLSCQ